MKEKLRILNQGRDITTRTLNVENFLKTAADEKQKKDISVVSRKMLPDEDLTRLEDQQEEKRKKRCKKEK